MKAARPIIRLGEGARHSLYRRALRMLFYVTGLLRFKFSDLDFRSGFRL